MSFNRCPLPFLCLFLSAAISLAAPAQDYEIKLSRPGKPGDRYHIFSVGNETLSLARTAGGETSVSGRSDTTIELDGAVTILETDKYGSPSRESIVVSKCTAVSAGELTTVVPVGAVIVAYNKDGDTMFDVNGAPADEDTARLLSIVCTESDGSGSDDEVFGAAERKKVGDSWPVNAEAMARAASRVDMKVEPKAVSGFVKVEALKTVGKTDCLLIRASVSFPLTPPAKTPFPPGVKAESAKMLMEFAGFFPVDTSLGRLEETADMTMSLKGRQQRAGAEVALVITSRRSVTHKITSLPAEKK